MALSKFVYKDRGPTSSKDYNRRVRETSAELFDLLGRVISAETEVSSVATLAALEAYTIGAEVSGLSAAIEAAQEERDALNVSTTKKVCPIFDSINVLETTATGDAIVGPLSWSREHGIVTLPYEQPVSKIGFYSDTNDWVINPAVRTAYTVSKPVYEANDERRAIDNTKATAFLVRAPEGDASDCTLTYYLSVPADAAGSTLVNYIDIDATPRSALTLVNVCYTNIPGATLDESNPDQWVDLWVNGDTVTEAKERFRPPQANGDNVQQDVGPRRYYFGERSITAVKVVVKSTTPITIDGNGSQHFVGFRQIDVGHVTFVPTGKRVFEYSLPSGAVRVSKVSPRLVNNRVSSDGLDGVGEELPEVKLYTKVNDVWTQYTANSELGTDKMRIEVTMNQASNGCTPILTGFDVFYART